MIQGLQCASNSQLCAHQKRTVTDYTNIEALCAMGSFQKLFRAEEVGNTEMLFRASGD